MFETRRLETETTEVRARRLILARSDVIVAILLMLTMFAGGYFRFVGQNWDDYVHFHPDERYLSGIATVLGGSFKYNPDCAEWDANCLERLQQYQECQARYPETNGRGGFFDADCSPYHPENVEYPHYVYGTLPLFMTRGAAELVVDWTGDPVWATYNGIHLVWRALSATADMIVILLVFFIGVRLHSKWTGLIAAVLYAAAVFPIQQSHFGTTDAITNLFVTLGIFFAVRAQDSGSWWDYAGFGVALGAAVASRVNVAPLAAVIVAVSILRMLPAVDTGLAWNVRSRLITRNFGGLVLAALMSLLVFRLGQPYAFRGPGFFGLIPDGRYLETLAHAQYTVSGEMEAPPNWQWVGRTGYLFPLQNMVLWGMGVAMGVAAWLAWAWSGWRLIRGRVGATRNLTLFTWVLIYFAFTGNLWVMSMRYYLPLYPVLALLAAWGLTEILRRANRPSLMNWRKVAASVLAVGVVGFTVLWAVMFTNIYRNLATFAQATYWVWENVPGDFAMRLDDAGSDVPLINIPFWNTGASPGTPVDRVVFEQASQLVPGQPVSVSFVAPASGTISSIHAPHIGDPLDSPDEKRLRIVVTTVGRETPLATATLNGDFDRDEHILGSAYDLQFEQPLEVQQGNTYYFNVEVEGGPLITSGAVTATELPWDEAVPAKVCTLPADVTLADHPPSGMFTARTCNGRDVWNGLLAGHQLSLFAEDTPEKRQQMQVILDQSEYIVIPTNRRYDSQSRIPVRWPMTERYYDALFSGELGFELVSVFQETFELGPLRISDQYLPTYEAPAWLNEFEAEEAFHVYDHPVVFMFRKRDDYSSANTAAILNSVVLNRAETVVAGGYNDPTIANVMTLTSLEADPAPTQLQFTEEMQAIQTEGGTWSERFDSDSLVNTNQFAGMIIWWLVIMVFGLAAWPLLFVAFPALADRGYGFAKFIGMLVVAWMTWVVSSLRLPVWNQQGIIGALVLMASLSGYVAWRNQESFIAFLRARWRLLLAMELLPFALFLVFAGVRLTNPDLWHSVYGGEKPMDFAYFNGVLRSTIFPPIDPWFAGGYINYYYFGYVIVGVPTLFLGVVPSIAYNLIVPTLFALVGIAAFSAAFSVVNGWRTSRDADGGVEAEGDVDVASSRPRRRTLGNPWVAGITALLLTVVVGNLDTARVFTNGVARLGGWRAASSLEDFLYQGYLDEYRQDYIIRTGTQPDEMTMMGLRERALLDAQSRAAEGRLGDRVRYGFDYLIALARGAGKMLTGTPVNIPPNHWFWAPTRTIAEIPGSNDGAINEMPFFTFLYGDLHAHMISMPMMLFAMVFVYNELMAAGRDRRGRWAKIGAIGFGALVVGLFQPTNTWDYPTFVLLGVLGLGYAWWLNWRRLTRWSLLSLTARVGGFVVLGLTVTLPFTSWFASAITQFKIWEGMKTPLWAYLQIHGLFIFLIVSLLAWETVRWMRSVRVGSLRGRMRLLTALLALFGGVLLITLVLVILGYQAALVVVPLVAWIVALFLRPGQSRPMQFVLVLAGLALSITMGTEVITLAYDNGRQNTIFKFYIQVWLLFSVVGGAAFAWLIRDALQWRSRVLYVWYGLAAILFFIAGMYPIMATRGKAVFRFTPAVEESVLLQEVNAAVWEVKLTNDVDVYVNATTGEILGTGTYQPSEAVSETVNLARAEAEQIALEAYGDPPNTLDGAAFMQYAMHGEQGVSRAFEMEADYAVIRWLQENVEGSPVIMEAQSLGSLYKWGNRISIYTGLPSVVGWDYHQRQQRSLNPLPVMVSQRAANVNAFYTTPDTRAAADILRHYNVEYVIVSVYERVRYGDTGGLQKLDRMEELDLLEVAYQEGEATIYRVNQDALQALLVAQAVSVGYAE